MAKTTNSPSSSTEGFFQVLPALRPQYSVSSTESSRNQPSELPDDETLARAVKLYIPARFLSEVGTDLHDLSRLVLLPSVLNHSVDAETHEPFLTPFTTFGEENRNDPLKTSEGWKALKAIGIEQGVVARGYDERKKNDYNRRVAQFAINHVWSHTATMTMCPMSMTDGAATLLSRHLEDADGDQLGRRKVFIETYRRLTSTNPSQAWTSGQWMTERTGGSDVSGTETIARKLTKEELDADSKLGRDQDSIGQKLGPWRIDGFKWFSSATDSDMTVLLAQTPQGLSAFYLPMRRQSGRSGATELNGIRIQRLKNKMGTKGLPTAELELKGARAWLIGEQGRGIKEIAAILNITRIHTACGSASYWARGLAISRAYSKVRRTRGHLLYENVQHVRWMASETVRYAAATGLSFFGCALLGCQEQGWEATTQGTKAEVLVPKDPAMREALLRLLTPVMKAQVSMSAVAGLRSAMECLGGVGYCENHEDGGIMNVARIFRDCVVNTIWEGTVSVMAEDVGRVIKDTRIAQGKIFDNVIRPWVKEVLSYAGSRFEKECAVIQERVDIASTLIKGIGPAELEFYGRELLNHLEVIASATILLHDASSDGDEVASFVASRYIWSNGIPESSHKRPKIDWQREADIDRMIFLGASFSNHRLESKSRL